MGFGGPSPLWQELYTQFYWGSKGNGPIPTP